MKLLSQARSICCRTTPTPAPCAPRSPLKPWCRRACPDDATVSHTAIKNEFSTPTDDAAGQTDVTYMPATAAPAALTTAATTYMAATGSCTAAAVGSCTQTIAQHTEGRNSSIDSNSSDGSSGGSSGSSSTVFPILAGGYPCMEQEGLGTGGFSPEPLLSNFSSAGSSFSSMDDELSEFELSAAKQAAVAAAAVNSRHLQSPSQGEPWWPPVEFSALVGLTFAAIVAGLTNALLCKPVAVYYCQSRTAYHLQQLGTANVSTKVLVLWMIALPFISLFGYLYHKAAHVSIREAMYKVYALLYRVPGVGIAKETNTASYVVANTVFLAGVFSFAAVIGIVSDEVKMGIKNSRSGNYNLRLSGHILLLNWNSSSTALLRQIASAHAEGGMFQTFPFSNRPPVVVLADKSKAQMDEAVHEMLRDRGLTLEVHTRQGNPFKGSELRKVAAGKASTIIVLHPDGTSSQASAEAVKTAVVMGLTALGPPAEQRIVVTGPLPAGSDHSMMQSLGVSARLTGHSAFQVLELPDSQLMHRLIAQTAAQPGVLTCWLDVLALANNSAQFYCAGLPAALQGKPYMEVRRAFAHAVLAGYRSPDGKAVLNPPETEVVPADSKLILLGRGGAAHLMASPSSHFYETAATAAAERLKRERNYRSKPRSIIVANWPTATTLELMEGFSLFTPPNSCVTFTVSEEPLPSWPTKLGNCRFNFITAPTPTDAKVLVEAGIKQADAVVLGCGSSNVGELEADARILSAILQVQDAVLATKRREPPHLVAPIKRYATSKLASQYLDVLAAEQQHHPCSPATPATASGGGLPIIGPALSALLGGSTKDVAPASQASASAAASAAVIYEPEFLVAQDVTSALITQVVSEAAYSDIMRALLFSDDGMELYLRNPASFNIPCGVPLSFAEVEEAVRLTNQTALGYIRGRSSRASGGSSNSIDAPKKRSDWGRPVLGCGAAHMVTFADQDRIVVLAQDYNL